MVAQNCCGAGGCVSHTICPTFDGVPKAEHARTAGAGKTVLAYV